MQAYFDEEIKLSSFAEDFYELYFYGDNFNCIFSDKRYNEFKSEEMQNLSLIKENVNNKNISGLIIRGGEPLLQRQALLRIFDFCKKNNIQTAIKTNLSKPKILESLLKSDMLDIVIAELYTDEDSFKKITGCGTFFKTSDKIYSDILKSIDILKKYDESVRIVFQTEVVPGYVFRKETFLDIASKIDGINSVWRLRPYLPTQNSLLKNVNPVTDRFISNLKKIIKEKFSNIQFSLT